MPYDTAGGDAYLAASKDLVDRCDLLIAVWDGSLDSGTGQAVTYARQRGRKTLVLWPSAGGGMAGYLSRELYVPFTDSTEPVPAELTTEEFTLRPIVVGDTELDYAAVMETREHLRLWRQSTWPEDDFTVEANRVDLVDLEERHAAHRAFTYTVLDPAGTSCLGCVYVFPTSATFLSKATVTQVGDDEWADVDAVVLFWARLPQMASGMDERLFAALRAWFKDEWKLEKTVYVTSEPFTQQVDLLNGTDLNLKFELLEPGKPRKRLAFG